MSGTGRQIPFVTAHGKRLQAKGMDALTVPWGGKHEVQTSHVCLWCIWLQHLMTIRPRSSMLVACVNHHLKLPCPDRSLIYFAINFWDPLGFTRARPDSTYWKHKGGGFDMIMSQTFLSYPHSRACARSSLFYLSTNTLVFWADPIIPYSICYSCYWPEFRPNFCWIHALADVLPGCVCHWRKERLKERKKKTDQTRVGATT